MRRKRDLLACTALLAACGLWTAWIAGPEPGLGDAGRGLRLEPSAPAVAAEGGAGPAEDGLVAQPVSRVELGMVASELPAEAPDEALPPPIPADAVQLRVLRWPDRKPLAGLRLTLIEQARGVVSQVVVPRGGRLRLDDFWLTADGLVGLRAKGFEPLHVSVDVSADGVLERVALLRPVTGYYGRVVDPSGAPLEGVPITGWWVESARPFVNEVSASVVAARVRKRLAPPREFPDFDVEVAQGTVLSPWLDELEDGGGEDADLEEADEPNTGPLLQFIAAHDSVSATQATGPDGWYYVEALGGAVLGQLTLFAETPLGASDVLREPLPSRTPRLPDIVLHEPQPLHGTVVAADGTPIPGARVLVQLADGWSRAWPPLITDEDGAFAFDGPVADLAIAVEVTGQRLASVDVWKAESADGMWDALVAIAPEGSSARALFDEAYRTWTAPLPRARGCVRAKAFDGDVILTLEAVGGLAVVVEDAEHRFPLEGARVEAIHGGCENGSAVSFTSADGTTSFALVDREWQPQVVRVKAAGYHSRTFALEPGAFCGLRRVRLTRIEPDGPGLARPDGPNGSVFDADGAPVVAQVVVYGSTLPTARPLWSGRSGADGTFRYTLPGGKRIKTLYFFALAELEDERQGARLGPLSIGFHATGEPVNLRLERGAPLRIDVLHLLEDRPYRLDWSLAPFPGAAPLATGALGASAGAARRERMELPVVSGWRVTVHALGATQGSVPSLDLTRGAGRQQSSYASLRHVWSEWEPVSEVVKLRVPPSGGRVTLIATGPISLSGVVEGMPWMARPDTIQIAALGARGTWVAPVGGNGWFDLRSLPPGKYRLVVYRRTPPDDAALTIHAEGAIHGELSVDTPWSRHDLVLEWQGDE